MQPSSPRRSILALSLLVALGLMGGCEQVGETGDLFFARFPHEAYAHGLEKAGLAETALGRAWIEASERAMAESVAVSLPFREVVFLDPAAPSALSYRFSLERGQQLAVDLRPQPGDTTRVFADLFIVDEDTTRPPRHTFSPADSLRQFTYNVKRTGDYLLRLQPELLRGGRYTVTVQTDASLFFPVVGTDSRAIRSYFGDSRDGGKRSHRGVDIFAPKRTPVVAAAEGMVTRVYERGLGGKVVWLSDGRGHRLYYAHLDTQLVRPNTRVHVGDTLGLIGNTGNAINTPSHLHFSVYTSGGAVDPFPFVHQPRERPPAVRADTTRLGQLARTAALKVNLQSTPEGTGPPLQELPHHTALRLLGSAGAWHRVRLPGGLTGYVPARHVEPLDRPLETLALETGRLVRAEATPNAPAIDSLSAGSPVELLALNGRFRYVQTSRNSTGWIEGNEE